jgi:hypothetical protein
VASVRWVAYHLLYHWTGGWELIARKNKWKRCTPATKERAQCTVPHTESTPGRPGIQSVIAAISRTRPTPHRSDSTGLRGTPRHKRNRRESYCCEGGPCIAKPISHCHRQTDVPQIPATVRRITFLSINTAALMVGRSVQILRGLFPSRPRQDTATESWKPL